jgi:formamidopyrimidine-DNA glycosylase
VPEGVEVKVITDQLRRYLAGKRIIRVDIVSGRYLRNGDPPGLDVFRESLPSEFFEVNCKGKFAWFRFLPDHFMFVTLGMTGTWQVRSPGERLEHERLSLILESTDPTTGNRTESVLAFVDVRNFGTVKFTRDERELDKKLLTLGWDPLVNPIHVNRMTLTKTTRKKTISEVLLDQSIFAGVGNYIKSEALYRARISPWKLVSDFNATEWNRLCSSVKEVMDESLAAGGTTIRDYRNVEGRSGTFQEKLRVYGRTVDPLGNEIRKEETPDGRSTYWVPKVQV